MKRGLFIIMVLILLPSVYASIELNGPSKEIYNLGEKIDVTGSIFAESNIFGLFKLSLACEDSTDLLIKVINIRQNEREQFAESLYIPYSKEGECKINAVIEMDGSEKESQESKTFTISKRLTGDFKLRNKQIQLGSELEITGTVYRLDGKKVNGLATIFFTQNDVNYLVDSADVKDGVVEYHVILKDTPPGDYLITIQVNDVAGNQDTFSLVGLTVVSELVVAARADETRLLPGKETTIYGSVKTILGDGIKEGEVEIDFSGVQYKSKLKEGNFNRIIAVPKKFKTGEHKVSIIVQDSLGNQGQTEITIYVQAIPTELKVVLEPENALPESPLAIIPSLFDQADELLSEEIIIKILDPKDKEVYSDTVVSNNKIEITMPENAAPGDWKVEASSSGLITTKNFYVGVLERLEFAVDNGYLIVKNAGNTVFNQPLKITLDGLGKESTIIEKVKLDIGEADRINLMKGTATGTYKVIVQDQVFENVQIEGKSVLKITLVLYVLLGIVILMLLYMISTRRKRFVKRIKDVKRSKSENVDDEESVRRQIMKDIEVSKKNRSVVISTKNKKDEEVWAGKPDVGSHTEETIFRKRRRKQKEDSERKKDEYGGVHGSEFPDEVPVEDDDRKKPDFFNMFD
jgi:hypothetical protein